MNDNITDPLYEIFEQELFHCDTAEANNDGFVQQVFNNYVNYLTSKKNTPEYYIHTISNDIYIEIQQMLQKKIYGYSCVAAYFKHNVRSKA